MAYFVGIDSGGTKTDCWLGDETRVLAKAQTATVKLTRVSQEIATARMRELLREVSAKARVPLGEVTRTCIGIAGYSIDEVRQWAERVVGEMVSGELEVCDDAVIALDAAFRGGPGILVIGGTGSAVLGRCADGTRFKAGGWGPGIGDEGSGFWIGREGLRRAFAAVDGGGSGRLLDEIRSEWGLKDEGEVVAFANARPGPDLSTLTPVVVKAAEAGDATASEVLEQAGRELARQVAMVWEKMLAHGERSGRVAYTGSVVEKIAWVRRSMRAALAESCPALTLADGGVHSTEGAMWRARRAVARG